MPERSEETRLRVLRAAELLDTPPEAAFDRLTRLAAKLLGAPSALVSLVDDRRQFFKSALGLKEPWASRRETPLTHSFCKFAVRDRSRLVVGDAREHAVFRDNLAVTELDVVAYAGIPLVVGDEAIGAFCVVDDKPRVWSEDELQTLQDLAESVVSEIELRIALRSAREQRAFNDALVESLGDGVLAMDVDRVFLVANSAARRFFPGAQVGKPLPSDWTQLHRSLRIDSTPLASEDGALARAIRGQSTDGLRFTLQGPALKEPVWVEASGRPVRDASGAVVAAIAVYRDVTERARQVDLYSTLVRSIPRAAVAMFDGELRCLAVDGGMPAAERAALQGMVGRPMREVAGLAGDDERFDAVEALFRRTIEGEEGAADYADTAEGRTVELRTAPIRDTLGRVMAGIVLAIDRTAERRALAWLRRSEQVYRAIARNLPNGAAFMVDRDLRFITADGPLVDDLLQREQWDTLTGRLVADVVAPENREETLAIYRAAFSGESVRREIRRGQRFYEVTSTPIFGEEGDVTHGLVFSYDVTTRKLEAERLRDMRDLLERERALLDATLEHIDDGVVLLDADRRVVLVNSAHADIFGMSKAELEGMNRDRFLAHVLPLFEDAATVRDALTGRPSATEEFLLLRPRRRYLRRSQTAVTLPTGEYLLVVWHDVTYEKELLAERERQLLVDAVTGIPDRRAAEKALQIEDARRTRGGSPLSVAVFDVDHFKRVNDEFGHATGDEVLRRVASTLAAQVRLTDFVGRWGGEEFLALLPCSLAGAVAFSERARKAVEKVRCPGVGTVTVSAGVAEIGPEETPADAIARADERLYAAKRGGRNRVEA